MKLSQVRIEARERNLILEFAEAGNRVLVTLCKEGFEPSEPTATLDIHDEDDAWAAAENAHFCCEGYTGSNGDIQEYYTLFAKAL